MSAAENIKLLIETYDKASGIMVQVDDLLAVLNELDRHRRNDWAYGDELYDSVERLRIIADDPLQVDLQNLFVSADGLAEHYSELIMYFTKNRLSKPTTDPQYVIQMHEDDFHEEYGSLVNAAYDLHMNPDDEDALATILKWAEEH